MGRAKLSRANDAESQRFDWGELHWYASGKLGNSSELTVGKCVIRPGRANPMHSHPNCEEVLHVLSGSVLHHVEPEEKLEMGPGDTISIPRNVRH